METNFQIVTPKDTPTYSDIIAGLSRKVWPEFMLHDPVVDVYWDRLFDYYPDYQFAFVDKRTSEVIGMANSIPIKWDKPISDLPQEGWDWALETGVKDYEARKQATIISALQISLSPVYQGKGWSSLFIEHMRALAKQKKFDSLIAPVRPTKKQEYPLASIDRYIEWENLDGLPFDPWLRTHAKMGAEIVKPCTSSMTISGTISEWEEWTGLQFHDDGPYIVSGALAPITMDLKLDKGCYIEPNVWMVHKLS